MYSVRTYNNIAPVGLACFEEANVHVDHSNENPDAIILRSHNLLDMSVPQNLKAIARAGAGVNNIPVDKLTTLGIPVFNTPGANANAVRELVICAMLLASRNVCEAWDFTRKLTGGDNAVSEIVEKSKAQFVGTELPGKTIAVIGLGAIGVRVANAACALGMNVIGFDPLISVQRAWELSSNVKEAHSLTEAIARADFITVHVPYSEKTKHLINESTIAAMKPGVVIINCARGGITDDNAILRALDHNIVKSYVTDFPNTTTINHSKVINLPHLGASTGEAEENCAVMAAKQLCDFLIHGTIVNSVNFPEVIMGRTSGFRIAIANRNVPNMVGQISTQLAANNFNIVDMINKSRGEVAYTLIDLDHEIPDSLQQSIAAIDGVLNVRLLGAGNFGAGKLEGLAQGI